MAANEPGQPALSSVDQSAFSTNHGVPGRALVVGAHPGDIEFGCGGTRAKWAAAGWVVHYAVLTDGSKGTWD
ncbi:MAG: PIG-L deacetylase family protein, partial [Actinomycetota bacterium]